MGDDESSDSGGRPGDPQPSAPATLVGVVRDALGSWGTTTRLLVVITVCAGLVVGGVKLLDVTLTAGPVQIAPR
ncbi:hypothetical protein [Actinokineospora sp. NPDC004072]